MQSLTIYLQGMGTGLGLIVAIGAQNAFVLTQGIRGRFALPVIAICIICDAALIAAGIAGMGTLISSHTLLGQIMAVAGAIFLGWYGLRSFRAAASGQHLDIQTDAEQSLGKVLLHTLAVTLLNPHVYLDTMIMLGGIANRFSAPWTFGLGAMSGSVIWFCALGLGGRLLASVFYSARAWQILDILVGSTMWIIAASLLMTF